MKKKCIGTDKRRGCDIDKPIEQFHIKGTRKDGSIRTVSICIECERLYSKAKYIANRERMKEDAKIRHREKMALLLENETLLEEKRARDREYYRKYIAEIKQDPVKYEKRLENRRSTRSKYKEQERDYSAKRNADPNIKQKRKDYDKKRYDDNKDSISLTRKERRKTDIEFAEKDRVRTRKRKIDNPEKCRAARRKWRAKRMKNDPVYKLRVRVSSQIATALHAIGSSKKGRSVMQFLPYTMHQLKSHLENLFEDWMTWENHGKYNPKTWDDNDPKTWKWNIDHIIPQVDLPYTSMEDENFKMCWALENLRPYGAKPNVLDGVHRTRHKKAA